MELFGIMADENQNSVSESQVKESSAAETAEVEDFSKLLEENDQALEKKSFEKGMIVEGIIVQIGAEFAYVNIGAKAEASLPVSELINPEDGKSVVTTIDVNIQDRRLRRERHQALPLDESRQHRSRRGVSVGHVREGSRQGH